MRLLLKGGTAFVEEAFSRVMIAPPTVGTEGNPIFGRMQKTPRTDVSISGA